MLILAGLCLVVILLIVIPAWPSSPPKPPPKPKVVGYDRKGNLIYEKPPNKIDFYA